MVLFSSASSALSRRKGETNRKGRSIPWAFVGFVLATVFLIFFSLYVNALNNAVHHHQHQHHEQQLRQQPQQTVKSPPQEKEKEAKPIEKAKPIEPKDENHKPPANVHKGPRQTLVLKTDWGTLKIVLLPNLSPSSVQYIRDMVKSGECPRCAFYRAEHLGILQGIIKNPDHPPPTKVHLGDCPSELAGEYKDNCHGPIMEHGMVAWAGGGTGPDFFIDWYAKPAKFWGTQHTAWGKVMLDDRSSLQTMNNIWALSTHKKGLTYLDETVKFTMSIEEKFI
ncbi:Cyclophilin type peptidyl-prolyl cis-trans isomerase/CLD [Seminavis robusta]|uniref:Cyclophilin type peptidyl-prolyl cis-trans isomerase/CLD n=1 Tax=Seminavis robusta TaxID=568900 RepID=A0A9N8H9K6_9STRA|nr:Cyclophilin type peptidyl-prolyl cis-trans isomerase/CLD [Seminavis robusta]|eukprot:Sro280_g106970.1 Cyclophilin type peptidyl-prolyl cis-trans isomerase/CLD (280) ;mRNA; f:10526-11365